MNFFEIQWSLFQITCFLFAKSMVLFYSKLQIWLKCAANEDYSIKKIFQYRFAREIISMWKSLKSVYDSFARLTHFPVYLPYMAYGVCTSIKDNQREKKCAREIRNFHSLFLFPIRLESTCCRQFNVQHLYSSYFARGLSFIHKNG